MPGCKDKDCHCWMADECLNEIRDALSSIGVPMELCPPMLYREAMHNMYVWSAKAGRDCQRHHNWHDGDEKAVAECLRESLKKQAGSKDGSTGGS